MTKETKEAEARASVITKNPDTLVFAEAPFYNLANIRRNMVSLIVRASSDPAKVKAIQETLTVLQEFLKIRADHGAAVRAASIAAEAKAVEARAKAAAEAREADAKSLLKHGEEQVKRAKGILSALNPTSKS